MKDFIADRKAEHPLKLLTEFIYIWVEDIEFSDKRDYIYHVLWDLGIYLHHLFNAFPYPYLGGVKRVGKTRVLTLHSLVAFNAIFSNNMSIASIYRLVQNAGCTLLIDETESLKNPQRAQEMRTLLQSGYKKGPKAYRIEKNTKGQLVPIGYEVYSPKALANIRGLIHVLEDRCKPTIMRRSINRKIIDREVDIGDSRWVKLRSKLYRFFLMNWLPIKKVLRQTE